MIYIYLGGIGSGKTLSIVKNIIDSGSYALTNFKLKNIKNYYRIKMADIIIKGEKTKDDRINWEFWDNIRNDHKNFSVYLDEIHNIIHSRRSMSKTNILMSKWVSQIRKMLSDNLHNNLFLISQTLRKIDIDFRELAVCYIKCRKYKIGDKIIIRQDFYNGLQALEMNKIFFKKIFCGNKYFKFYNTLDMITFGDAEEYV